MRALLSATFLLATLLFAGHQASAAPPTATDQPDLLTPTNPPEPQPCEARPVPCDITFPTLTARTPTTEPTAPSEPTTTSSTTSKSTATDESTGESTDDGTAAGPGRTTSPVSPPGPAGTNWWLITIPVLALLALAAAGTVLLIQRSERR